jgi:hypothetical protein
MYEYAMILRALCLALPVTKATEDYSPLGRNTMSSGDCQHFVEDCYFRFQGRRVSCDKWHRYKNKEDELYVPVEIRSEHLPNTSLERYCCTSQASNTLSSNLFC